MTVAVERRSESLDAKGQKAPLMLLIARGRGDIVWVFFVCGFFFLCGGVHGAYNFGAWNIEQDVEMRDNVYRCEGGLAHEKAG